MNQLMTTPVGHIDTVATYWQLIKIEHLERSPTSDTRDGDAPWWENVAFDRVACNSGAPMAPFMADGYRDLIDRVEALAEEESIPDAIVESAKTVLKYALFAGIVPPRLTCHGCNAIVFYWSVGKSSTFITVGDGEASMLQESDRRFIRRQDHLREQDWARIFS